MHQQAGTVQQSAHLYRISLKVQYMFSHKKSASALSRSTSGDTAIESSVSTRFRTVLKD
jgi:hypothetical protein